MLLATLIGLSATLVAAPPGTRAIEPICKNPGIVAADAAPIAGIRPLGKQPPARQIKAVVREIDGCNRPLVVSARVGTPRR